MDPFPYSRDGGCHCVRGLTPLIVREGADLETIRAAFLQELFENQIVDTDTLENLRSVTLYEIGDATTIPFAEVYDPDLKKCVRPPEVRGLFEERYRKDREARSERARRRDLQELERLKAKLGLT